MYGRTLLAMACLIGQMSIAAAQPIIGLVAQRGEWVTTETTNTKICQLSKNMHRYEIVYAPGWCENWSIAPPVPGTPVPTGPDQWIRCKLNCQLHFQDGWR